MEASASSRNPAPQDRLPTKTYDKTDKLTIDGVHIRLYHWAPGHTSGDTVVYLPDQKIVFGGDLLVTNRPDTMIHMEKNGSAAGWIENAKGMLGLNADTYLTGHGDMMTKADVQKKLDLFRTSTTRSRPWSRRASRSTKSRPRLANPPPRRAKSEWRAARGHLDRSDLQGSAESEELNWSRLPRAAHALSGERFGRGIDGPAPEGKKQR